MTIAASLVDLADIRPLRDLYCHEAHCQIISYAFLDRGWANPFVLHTGERIAGYGALATRHHEGRIIEFCALSPYRVRALDMFRELVRASGAVEVEAQTNMPIMVDVLYAVAQDVRVESVLFQDDHATFLECPDGLFRERTASDDVNDDRWLIEAGGHVVASGGALHHYNPPYADIYMRTAEDARRRGFGSYLVQEIKRICYESGKLPAARCNPDNAASRRTLEKAGFVTCGRMLAGRIPG